MRLPFTVRRPAPMRELSIDRGRVACPLRGDTDVEWCWSCRDLAGLGSGLGDSILCRTDDHHDVRILAAATRR